MQPESSAPVTLRGRPRGPQGPRIRTPTTSGTSQQACELPPEGVPRVISPPHSPVKVAFTGSSASDICHAEVFDVKVPAPKLSSLTLSSKINFETTPITYKALTLEAAQWSFSSHELQQIVSRAIRLSSNESFIRLLSLEALDRSIPRELERLDNMKAVTQSKYRFLTQRRNMLLQALNSIAISASGKFHSADTVEVVGGLTVQLSENTADGDRLTEQLLWISDQQTQLGKAQECHWASALAVALRKLHKSYARRTKELLAAKVQITRLEGELEDAWREAEKLAKEMDEDGARFISSDDEDNIDTEMAEIVTVHYKARVEEFNPISNAATVRRSRSASDRANRVQAAKKRSGRSSALRLARKTTASRPSSSTDQDTLPPAAPPPVPELVELSSQRAAPPEVSDTHGPSSVQDMGATASEVHSHPVRARDDLEPEPVPPSGSPEQPLLSAFTDTISSHMSSEFDDSTIPSFWLRSDLPQPKARIKSLVAFGTSRIDNERMRPSSSALLRAPSFSSARAISYDSDGIISYESGRMTSLDSVGAESLPKPNRRTPSDDIGDVPSALLQHSRSRMQTSSSDGGKGLTPYKKLKTLTKRYTLPFHRVGRKKPPQPQ